MSAASKAWRKAHAAALAASNAAYRKANPEKEAARNRKYYEANREKKLARKPTESQVARVKAYAKAHPEQWAERAAARRERTPKCLTRRDRDCMRVFYSRAKAMTLDTGVAHEVDHVIPLRGERVSGLHVPWNLAVIPKLDNARKGNRF